MPGRLEVGFRVARPGGRPASRSPDTAFRAVVLGDLSGRGSRGPVAPETLGERELLAADVDTFEEVLARLSPRLRLVLPDGRRAEAEFHALEDFHPDALWTRLELFEGLSELRRRLLDPATSAQAATELRARLERGREVPARPVASPAGAEADDETLERLLGARPSGSGLSGAASPSGVDLARFLRDAVAPHVVPEPVPGQAVQLQALDEAAGEGMRAVLHHPEFQALEALWRSVHGLVTALELGEDLQLFLLDATPEELAGDLLRAGTAPESSALHRLLVERHGPGAPGGEPWSALVGGYGFGPGEEDVELLAALGALASRAGGPFLARALPGVLGCASAAACADPRTWQPLQRDTAERWEALRRGPAARWVGLALPRILLRLPYGTATDEVEGFAFEECTPVREHDGYLWGNPAFVCARLLSEAFRDKHWAMEPGDCLEVGDLPAHTFAENGEPKLQPCAEVILPERAATAILDRGLMPLLSYPNRHAVRLLRFQSLAEPPAPLSGPWG